MERDSDWKKESEADRQKEEMLAEREREEMLLTEY